MHRRTLLILLGALILPACDDSPAANPMQERVFWSYIAAAAGPGGDEHHTRRLEIALTALPPAELIAFYNRYRLQFDRAETGELWAAGTLLNRGHGTDDGFEYFRNWLIGQGREVFEAALADPDSLAGVDVVAGDEAIAEWEAFAYVAAELYKRKTGTDIHDAMPPRPDGVAPSDSKFEWSDYTNEVMAQRLPKLWAKYGEAKMRSDRESEAHVAANEARMRTAEVAVPGLGIVKAGRVLHHGSDGPGTVLGVEAIGGMVMVRIQFGDEVQHMVLSREGKLLDVWVQP